MMPTRFLPRWLRRQCAAHVRLFVATGCALPAFWLLPPDADLRLTTRLLIAWDFGTSLYLLLTLVMILRSTPQQLHARARLQDEGRFAVLGGVILATLACLAAIFFELADVGSLPMPLKGERIGLGVFTIIASWTFIHLMFAVHYAHDFYAARARGAPDGLLFPGETEPDYGDFIYFAAVIGTSGQTADVAFTSRAMRRLGLVHCVLAYAFNTTLLALTINIAAGLL